MKLISLERKCFTEDDHVYIFFVAKWQHNHKFQILCSLIEFQITGDGLLLVMSQKRKVATTFAAVKCHKG